LLLAAGLFIDSQSLVDNDASLDLAMVELWVSSNVLRGGVGVSRRLQETIGMVIFFISFRSIYKVSRITVFSWSFIF
jgi:hypothetical protein